MNRNKPLYALASVLVLSGAAPGCATYGKCGLDGCPGDSKTTADVEKRLREDPETAPASSIYVQTSNHVVYLSGTTTTRVQKERAEADARKAAGVTDVVNTIVGHMP
jgi:osmotically-inducible protein OsmY